MYTIALCGNPNSGKTSIFNALTGAHQHVGNWPGVTVERKEGETLITQFNTAMSSSPDAIGISSWNEFSENSHIEPSENFNSKYLEVLSTINQLPIPDIGEFDSSEPQKIFPEIVVGSRQIALAGITVLFLASIIVIIRRRV